MITAVTRTFALGTDSDETRNDAFELVKVLRELLPDCDVSVESVKTYLSILTITKVDEK